VKKPTFVETLETMLVELAIEAPPEHRAYAIRARDIMSMLANCEDDERPHIVALAVTLWLITVPPGYRNEAMRLLLVKTNEGIRGITKAIRESAEREGKAH
jgi:hypothetical protein